MNKTMSAIGSATLAFGLGIFPLFTPSASADPLVQFPTGNAAWTVDITYTHGSAPAIPAAEGQTAPPVKKAKKIEVSQIENVRKTRITWTDGKATEQWTIPSLPIVFKEYSNGVVFPVPSGHLEAKSDSFNMPSDLSAFDWVTPQCLQGKVPISYQGQQCYHYLGSVSPPLMPNGNSGSTVAGTKEKREAWIDSRTLLPVALDTETSHCVFTFLPPPAGPLEMPGKFKKGVAYYKHVMGLP